MATIWARHGPECRSINPAGIEICHAVENRCGISRVNWGEWKPWTRERDGERVSMERDDAVGGPRRLLVNTKAPRRFTTPPDRGPCLTYPRLSGTNHFHCLLRATTRASTRARAPAPCIYAPSRRDAFRKPSDARGEPATRRFQRIPCVKRSKCDSTVPASMLSL